MMKDETMPESHENSVTLLNMQMELHSKGAVLSKAWTDLFSFITQYQAELCVKENAVEIAEKEIDERKKQLKEMQPLYDTGNNDIAKLQDLITDKERQLHKAQSELLMKEESLSHLQTDLTCNRELVDKLQSDLIENQSNLVRCRNDLEQYKSDLHVKEEQINIKDNLLKKLQGQLMKENTELREQLDMERKNHEITKRCMAIKQKTIAKSSTASQPAVIEKQDTHPPLNLSVLEPENFGLSNVVSLSQTQPQEPQHSEEDSESLSDYRQEDEGDNRFRWQTTDRLERKSKYSESSFETQSKQYVSVLKPKRFKREPEASEESEVFFPLSVTGADSLNTSQIDAALLGQMPSTPSSGTSDSNQGPVPVSGPIPSSSAGLAMPSGVEGSGNEKNKGSKLDEGQPQVWWCGSCSKFISSQISPQKHFDSCHNVKKVQTQPKPVMFVKNPTVNQKQPGMLNNLSLKYACKQCGEAFSSQVDATAHSMCHFAPPLKCEECGLEFINEKGLNMHLKSHNKCPHRCGKCNKAFTSKGRLIYHTEVYHPQSVKKFDCDNCGENFSSDHKLTIHKQQQCVKRVSTSSTKKCTQSFKFPDRF